MSYILDALKKSDQERKQGDIPNLQTVHVALPQEAGKPWILYAIVLLLLLALAFTIGILLSTSLDSGSQSSVAADEKLNVEVGLPEMKSAMDTSSRMSSSVKALQDVEEIAASVPVVEPIIIQREEKLAGVTGDEKDIPYLNELADYQQQRIPEMSFAGHVYSSDAASRSVIINGRAMVEGEELIRGMRVEKITSSGVVIRFNDMVFRVDVLQNWSFE